MKVWVLLMIFGLSQAKDCFDHDTDYYGTNINNGLEERTDSATDCQRHCQATSGCVAFTWASKNFPGITISKRTPKNLESNYHFLDADYQNACWLKGHVEYSFSKDEAVSGPKECPVEPTTTVGPPPDGPCCARLNFASSGNLADGGQNHVLGDYVYAGEGPEGHWNYEQAQNNQFGTKGKLYYFPYLGAWYIGDEFDTNMGYAINWRKTQCAEDLDPVWQWWNWEEDEWTEDSTAQFTCAD